MADTADWVPLHAAAIYGHLKVGKNKELIKIIELFINELIIHLKVVKEFLRMPDPDIHVEDHTEDTPLHLAAMMGHVKICEELVKKDRKLLEQGRYSVMS